MRGGTGITPDPRSGRDCPALDLQYPALNGQPLIYDTALNCNHNSSPSRDGETRKLYNAVLAKGGEINWHNFFERAAQVKGNRIIVTSEFRRGLIAERYAELIKREGFELVGGDVAASAPKRAEPKAAEAPLTAQQRANLFKMIKKPMVGSGYKPARRGNYVP